jgi:catechol 2,3-dioxygenase-like lactoylglutathione lyase family enzyme
MVWALVGGAFIYKSEPNGRSRHPFLDVVEDAARLGGGARRPGQCPRLLEWPTGPQFGQGTTPEKPMPREGPEPILPAQDVSQTRQFYESLGFKAGYGDDRYDILRRGNLVVHLERQDDLVPATNHTSCYWRVSNADALHKEFSALGLPRGTHLTEPSDEPWGMREFTLKDPAGNLIRVGHELTNP